MRHLILAGLCAVSLAGCAGGPQPVDKPCGVITDSLQNVNATSTAGQERLDVHFERGTAAGCWKRVGNLPVLADAPKPHPVKAKKHPKPRAAPAPAIVLPDLSTPQGPAPDPDPIPVPPPDPSFMDRVKAHLNSGVKW